MPKKRTPRQRRQAQDQAQAEQRRLARQEQEREERARLVDERAGDPPFVQRTALPGGGSALTWDPDPAGGQVTREAFEANKRAFREEFSRNPAAEDPVLFDPDADEPVPLTGQAWDNESATMARPPRSSMSSDGTVFERSPLYVVLFSAADAGAAISPVVSVQEGIDTPATVPHGLDRDVAAALPGLWYCLHLPNTFRELIDIPALAIKAAQALHLDHHILLAPIELFDPHLLDVRRGHEEPVLVVCPDELLDEAARRSAALGFALPPTGYSQLSSDSLREHWQAIHAHFAPDAPYLGGEPTLTDRLDLAPADLPRRWLARQWGIAADSPFVTAGDLNGVVAQTVRGQVYLAATARLEREDTAPDVAERLMPQVVEEERRGLRIPVVLAVPGVARRTSGVHTTAR